MNINNITSFLLLITMPSILFAARPSINALNTSVNQLEAEVTQLQAEDVRLSDRIAAIEALPDADSAPVEPIIGYINIGGLENPINIRGFEFDVGRHISMEVGNLANREVTRPAFSEVTITFDDAQDQMAALNRLAYVGASATTVDLYLDGGNIHLAGVLVSGMSDTDTAVGLSFSYTQITLNGFDGYTAGYDLTTAEPILNTCKFQDMKLVVDGSATTVKGEFTPVREYLIGVARGISSEAGNLANREVTRPSVSEVTMTIDGFDTCMFAAAMSNDTGISVTLEQYSNGNYQKGYVFRDVLVSNFSLSSSSGALIRKVSFSFTAITVMGSEGTAGDTFTYDLVTATPE